MKFLPWLVILLTVYLSSFFLFVAFRKTSFGDTGVGRFLNLNFMLPTPQQRRPFVFSAVPSKIDPESPRSPHLNLQSTDLRWSMIVFVKSHSSHRSRRMLARMTWSSFEFIDGVRIEYVFVIGKPESIEEKTRIEAEINNFGDLLQINLEEKYTSVGFKTLASMQYAATHFPSDWMYVSCDDDIAPDWVRLIEEFDRMRKAAVKPYNEKGACGLDGHLPIMCGFGCIVNAVPKREENSKWYIKNVDYPLPFYPTYCLGGFYGMSVDLASELFEISRTLPFFWIDDVWVTGFLRLKRFFGRNFPCQEDENLGLWSTSDEAFSSTGTEHDLLVEWTKYVAKIHEKRHVYVDDQPRSGKAKDSQVPYEWKAWLEYVFQEHPVVV